jgi:hypothetical protein
VEFFWARWSDKSVESAWALLFVFSEIGVFPFVRACRVSFCVFATVFGTDSSLFSSSENYFSMGKASCKDEDRVVKRLLSTQKAARAGVPAPPKRPTLKTEGSGTRKG